MSKWQANRIEQNQPVNDTILRQKVQEYMELLQSYTHDSNSHTPPSAEYRAGERNYDMRAEAEDPSAHLADNVHQPSSCAGHDSSMPASASELSHAFLGEQALFHGTSPTAAAAHRLGLYWLQLLGQDGMKRNSELVLNFQSGALVISTAKYL